MLNHASGLDLSPLWSGAPLWSFPSIGFRHFPENIAKLLILLTQTGCSESVQIAAGPDESRIYGLRGAFTHKVIHSFGEELTNPNKNIGLGLFLKTFMKSEWAPDGRAD